MKFIKLVAIVFATTILISANDEETSNLDTQNSWNVTVSSGFMLALNAYTNWEGGELATFAWTANLSVELEKQLAEFLNNRNTLKLGFGMTMFEDTSSKRETFFCEPIKSTDLIDFESLLSFTLQSVVDPYICIRLISQFWDNSTPQSLNGNPIEITESFGVARSLVKKELISWNTRLGGAIRQTINRNRHDDSITTNDIGAELVMEFSAKQKSGVVGYSSLLKVYEAFYRNIETHPDYQYPDINWENKLNVNLSKYIMLNGYFQLIYDKEINNGIRTKTNISLGLTYNFTNKTIEQEK